MEVTQWDEGINGLLCFEVEDGKRLYYAQLLQNGDFHVFRPINGEVITQPDAIISVVRSYADSHGLKL